MNHDHYSPSDWQRFVDGNVTDEEDAYLTAHLNECVACGSALERLVADNQAWSDVQALLTPSADEVLPHAGIGATDELPSIARQILDTLLPSDFPESLGRIGSFEVRAVIGFGAMGVVFKAHDRSLDRLVAIKVMSPALASSGVARQRFSREAKAAAAIQHPNVIEIYSVADHRGLPYLVMPLIKGESLQRRVDRCGVPDLPELLRIACHIAAGLAAAHRQGVIHRDIKPSNILMTEGVETALIADFGLARAIDEATMTRSGTLTGTPEYMSPEQSRGEVLDVSSDIFSFGSLLYFLCTGRAPFHARTTYGVIRKIAEDRPPPIHELNPSTPDWLVAMIARLHQKSASVRPTASQALEWFEDCLAYVYQPHTKSLPEPFVHGSQYRKPSLPLRTIGVACMLIALCLGGLFSLMNIPNDPTPSFAETVSTSGAVANASNSEPVADKPLSNQTVAEQSVTDDNVTTSAEVWMSVDRAVFKTIQARFPNTETLRQLKVDINRGSIEVAGHDKPDVILEILQPITQADANSDAPRSIFVPRYNFDIDSQTNTIEFDSYNQDYRLDVRILVPRKTNIIVENYYDGYLRVQNIAGAVDASSQNSSITVQDVSGRVSASNYNGDIEVLLNELGPADKVDIESYNGDVELRLPVSIAATVAVSTAVGSYQSDFNIELASGADSVWLHKYESVEKSDIDGYRFGTINGGGVPLRVQSEKGTIRILKTMTTK